MNIYQYLFTINQKQNYENFQFLNLSKLKNILLKL